MNRSVTRSAWIHDRKKMVPSVIVVVMLVLVSAVAMIVSSGRANPELTIISVSASPSEVYVDQEVEWTVVVDLQYNGQRVNGLLFTWDWDDGTYSVDHLASVNDSDTAVDVQTHAWAEPGLYEVMVSVWDGYGSDENPYRNVSATMPFVVNEGITTRSVDYRWHDMFAHPLGPWYEDRLMNYGSEYAVTDTYPYLYVKENAPPGNIQVNTFMKLDIDATDIPEVNMNDNPEFLPYLGDARGGNAEIGWHMDYLTWNEADEKLGVPIYWYDGWFIGLNGTVALDRNGAKSVLGLSDSEFDDFDTWWAVNSGGIKMEWKSWLNHEASNDRLATYNMYEYDLTFLYFEMDAEKVSDQVIIQMDTVSWGMESLMTRWLHEAFMPTEWYMEDMYLNATIGPDDSNIYLTAAVGYALTASESIEDGSPCWTWQAMLQDFVESSPEYPISDFDPYVDLEYPITYPGNEWYHTMMPYDYTPGAWNLSEGETLTFEWPAGEVLFLVDDPTGVGSGLVDGALDFWSSMTVNHSEPMPADAPGNVAIDMDERRIEFTGPFDMWTWSRDQVAHSHLSDEWDRLGVMPYGMPYIEFMATGDPDPPPVIEDLVEVSDGTSITIYEQTGAVYSYTFSVDTLMTSGASFTTMAMLLEEYTVTSDGTFVAIHCYRNPPYNTSGTGTGNNIVAVRLDGADGYPDGLWASLILNYTIGYGGIEESRWNALGPSDQLGPYGDSLCTYLGDYDSEMVLGFTAPSAPPSETSLIYTIYDMFEEPWGPWWDCRVYSSVLDSERLLTSEAGRVTYLYSENHNPDGNNDQGLIYAPYRWNIDATSIPNMDVHTPVFMPVLGSGQVLGAEATMDAYAQYVCSGPGTWWEDYWIATWGGESDWVGDSFADWTDGYYLGTVYTVTMNREAAEEWMGMPMADVPSDWWAANGDLYESLWEDWMAYQGNEVFDIFCGYEWPYYDLGTFMSLTGDSTEVVLDIAHLSWGWEALLTRWLDYTQLSVHQPYFEDVTLQVDFRDSVCDFYMDAVCQWSLHAVKQNASAPGDNAPCAWVWEPIGLDYIPSSTSHPESTYDPYYVRTYESWNCGDPLYGTEVPYEVTPSALSLPSYAKLVIELPEGDALPGYYAEPVPDDAIKSVWSGDTSDYDAIRYSGEMDLGFALLGGCTDWTYDPVSKVMTINGPWNFTNPRDDGYLYHGAPWIEFNVNPMPSSESLSAEGSAAPLELCPAIASVGAELASLVGTMCAVMLATVAMVASVGRRREC